MLRIARCLELLLIGVITIISLLGIVLVIRVTPLWSQEGAGWAQAIGSIAALGVAIFVMSRQNAHAAQLLIDADTLAIRRRAAAALGIVERAMSVAQAVYREVSVPRMRICDLDSHEADVNAGMRALKGVFPNVNAIPVHELGSYEMAEGLQLLTLNLEFMFEGLEEMKPLKEKYGLPDTLYMLYLLMSHLDSSYEQFRRGVDEIK